MERAFKEVGITIRWEGKEIDEQGIDAEAGTILVKVDPRYFRPTEVDLLQGDASKAARLIGWKPRVRFEQLVREMVVGDLRDAEKEQLCKSTGV